MFVRALAAAVYSYMLSQPFLLLGSPDSWLALRFSNFWFLILLGYSIADDPLEFDSCLLLNFSQAFPLSVFFFREESGISIMGSY